MSIPPNTLRKSNEKGVSPLFFVAVGLLVVAVIALLLAWHFYSNLKRAEAMLNSAQSQTEDQQKQLNEVVAKVGRLIVLPEGETPTLATVTDPEQLKSQPFFANAKAGDQVLIYAQAGKAILYDPAADKIVEVAPVNIGAAADAETNAESSNDN